ncbi:methyltransferase [Amycolatopsis sp. CA-126428]|uniref:methyltransferase n=1 Tax=Amycolatopsis sp. CA-126428 TaxID=2073158 RepID=UPI00130485E9|nr:methyltransferase [Amycolatopsis sp. CA-126428]
MAISETPATGQSTSERGSGRTLRELSDLITPMTIRVAVTLRIPQKISGGGQTAEALAAATNSDPDVLERILFHLVGVGVLTRDDDGRFGLTHVGAQLLEDDGAVNPDFLDLDTVAGRAELSFIRLPDVARSGDIVAYSAQYGTGFWDDLGKEPSSAAHFDQVMADGMQKRVQEIAESYDWGALGSVVDVGGGNGTLLAGLLRAHPGLRGTVVDRDAGPATRTFREAGLTGRAEALSGSFLEPLPPGAGGYVVSRIQSDWNDADVRTILGHCADAAGAAGKVIVVDEFAAEEGVRTDSETDLRMLMYYGGKERTMEQVRALAADVGLSVRSLRRAADWTIMELSSARGG